MSSETLGQAPSQAEVAPGSVSIGADWATQVTGRVEKVVSVIRDRTVRPVESAVRYLVFGLLASVVGLVVLVLFCIVALRVLDNEVPVFHTRIWASYLVLSGIFWVAGLLLTRARRARR
jgi:ABC-type Co2+ transport system permease subunit